MQLTLVRPDGFTFNEYREHEFKTKETCEEMKLELLHTAELQWTTMGYEVENPLFACIPFYKSHDRY